MIGLKKGTVKLVPHQKEWNENAESIIKLLKQLLGDTALDIQHIGSTSIFRFTQSRLLILLLLFTT